MGHTLNYTTIVGIMGKSLSATLVKVKVGWPSKRKL